MSRTRKDRSGLVRKLYTAGADRREVRRVLVRSIEIVLRGNRPEMIYDAIDSASATDAQIIKGLARLESEFGHSKVKELENYGELSRAHPNNLQFKRIARLLRRELEVKA